VIKDAIIPQTIRNNDVGFYRAMYNKSWLKISGQVAVGVPRDSRKISGHPYSVYVGRIARSS